MPNGRPRCSDKLLDSNALCDDLLLQFSHKRELTCVRLWGDVRSARSGGGGESDLLLKVEDGRELDAVGTGKRSSGNGRKWTALLAPRG
eukprot:768104-Hanusia_phi.AAC.12